jgi:uncharacterized protein YfiM (DUF2279 family)
MGRRLRVAALVLLVVLPSAGHAQAAPKPQRDTWLGSDKVKHFFLAGFIESMTFGVLQAAGANRHAAFNGAIGAAAIASIGKEVHDKKTKGLFSLGDLTWDALGAGAAGLVLRKTQR